jgi:branched-chain amino acid transport system substrate-binding protein
MRRAGHTALARVVLVCGIILIALAAITSASPQAKQSQADLGLIKIGVLFPLTGSNASAGQDALHGAQLAASVLNGRYPAIKLPKLTVGKLGLEVSDTQGNPQVGSSEVDRLVRGKDVAAVLGAYQSAVTLTASQRAELFEVPFMNGSSSSTSLTQRGLKWFFRTGPSDLSFTETYFAWLNAIKKKHPVRRVAIFHTNDQFGNDGAKVIRYLAGKNKVNVVADISFQSATTDLTSQVQRLRSARPNAVFVLMFTPDAILFHKTLAQLGYTPPIILAYGSGYADPQFVKSLGKLADYSVTRAAWALEIARKNSVARSVADAFRKRFGQPMTENSAREFTAMMTLGLAIQRANSKDPGKIRSALASFRGARMVRRTIMPWKGVSFNKNGQNVLAAGVIEQIVKGKYRVIWPRQAATAQVVWPMPPLDKRQ